MLAAWSLATLAACAGADSAPDPRPGTTASYRGLTGPARAAAAQGCRDRAAARMDGLAARQLAAVDAERLRRQLDITLAGERNRVPFERACAEVLPLVTQACVLFAGVTGNGIDFTYPRRSQPPA